MKQAFEELTMFHFVLFANWLGYKIDIQFLPLGCFFIAISLSKLRNEIQKGKTDVIITNDYILDVVPIDTSDVEPSEMPASTADGQLITSSDVTNQQPISSHQTNFPQTSQAISSSQEDSQPIISSQVTSQPIVSSLETSQPITISQQITASSEPSTEPSSTSDVLLASSNSESRTLQTVLSTPTTHSLPSMSTTIKPTHVSSSMLTPDITPTSSFQDIEHTCNEQRRYSKPHETFYNKFN